MTEVVHKLWDRVIDIGVGVITGVVSSVLIAIIGLISWKVKLRLDLWADEEKQLNVIQSLLGHLSELLPCSRMARVE